MIQQIKITCLLALSFLSFSLFAQDGCISLESNTQIAVGDSFCITLNDGSAVGKGIWRLETQPPQIIEFTDTELIPNEDPTQASERLWYFKAVGEGECEILCKLLQPRKDYDDEPAKRLLYHVSVVSSPNKN